MSKEIQDIYAKALEKIDRVFRENGIQYWLDAGTLLCAYRDGDLEFEHDIDIGVYSEDYGKIVKIAYDLTYDCCWRMFHSKLYHTIYLEEIDGCRLHCDIIQWYASGDIRTCWGVRLPFAVPSGMLDEFTEIKLQDLSDTSFFAPKETERYLEMYYGKEDWKKRMQGIEYHTYQMLASTNDGPRYEINEYSEACAEFWPALLGYKVEFLGRKK